MNMNRPFGAPHRILRNAFIACEVLFLQPTDIKFHANAVLGKWIFCHVEFLVRNDHGTFSQKEIQHQCKLIWCLFYHPCTLYIGVW